MKDSEASLRTRFWEKVNICGIDECWEWQASLDSWGYGHIGHKEKIMKANRISWILHFGKIPKDMFVCHSCDNPKCVNPKHLFLGTPKDNTQDMIKKGRIANRKGQNNPNSKLSVMEVLEIIKLYSLENISQRELAKQFGISRRTIADILSKRTWKHIERITWKMI